MRKFLSAIIRVLSFFTYVVIVIALLVTAPLLLGYRPVVVLSGSMEPAFPVGSVVYYKSTPFEEIQVGDAITFKIGESSLATHRVVEKNENDQTFITRGDANPSEDTQPVSYTEVVGRTTPFALPFVGYFTNFVQHWYVIAVMGAILLVNMFVDTPKEKKSKASSSQRAFGPAGQGAFDDLIDDEEPKASAVKKEKPAKKKTASKVSAESYFDDL